MPAKKIAKRLEGKAAGGHARAAKMTKEERSEAASLAAKARWADAKGIPKAGWEGEMEIGDIKLKCAVIPPEKSTEEPKRVISETEFMKALGMYRSGALSVRREVSESGAQIPLFLAYKNLKPYIIRHLGDVHYEPTKVLFKNGKMGHGIDAALIPKVCEIWMDAQKDKVLGARQEMIAQTAEILLRGLARVGITALIDEATGYQEIRDRHALQEILNRYIKDEWAKWSRRFQPEFYKELFRLKGIPFPPNEGTKKPAYVGHWTNDIVYKRLAPGVLQKLREVNPKTSKSGRARKHHQHLTDEVGIPELKEHLSNVTFLMRTCRSWNDFERRLDEASPKYGDTMRLALDDD